MTTCTVARMLGLLLALFAVVPSFGLTSSNRGFGKESHDFLDATPSPSSTPKLGPPKSKHNANLASTTRRMTLQARTTLLNGHDMSCMGPAEAIFFEDTWKAAYKSIHAEDDQDKAMDVRSVVLEDEPRVLPSSRRQLLRGYNYQQIKEEKRGPEPSQSPSPQPTTPPTPAPTAPADPNQFFFFFAPVRYFDIWSLVEFTCSLCSPYRRLDEEVEDVKYKDMNSRFEVLLSDMLRQGPYECFRDIQGLQVTFVSV
jgi:hypothetical protein